ncbi:MAG: bifunctional diaminohydroxyphosphoribosylaminopyrimidine deaminase/5-amino-6-(5-phosphoribosylamino)uracil reductase RibD [Prevotella sp.]|nr:bifunctional diaminohydroxyphosphoribosylaminopyrimidine deaminase/5-amino-6-(5-phosphoribosylamino)uracil reductase RibD [Prevotella sp.]
MAMTTDNKDIMYMHRCLQLAEYGRYGAKPNPMVGAVIVAGDRIIGEGYHERCGQGHAEVNAFASVSPSDEKLLPAATMYVSLEPCAHYGKTPPCARLIIEKGIKNVVVGCVDSFSKVSGKGIAMMREAGINVKVGILAEKCRWLNRRFFTFNERKRPYITLKWAQTVNGFIDNEGTSLSISTTFTRQLVHKLRAENDAILVGRTTYLRDHPKLDVRHWTGESPYSYILSHCNTIDNIINDCCENNRQSLLVEGGLATLNSFIDADLWDEIRVETAPFTVANGTEAPRIPSSASLNDKVEFDNNIIALYSHNPRLAK